MRDAPLRLRYLALAIDLALSLSVLAGFVLVAAFAPDVAANLWARFGVISPRLPAFRARSRTSATPGEMGDEKLIAAIGGTVATLSHANRNRRGLGFRAVHLRRVDARTGGPISARSAVVGRCFDAVSSALSKRLLGARERRHLTQMQAVAPMLNEIAERYANDPAGFRDATMRFFESFDINPFASIGWAIGRTAAWHLLSGIWIGERRTLRDRVTGTRVIVEESDRS